MQPLLDAILAYVPSPAERPFSGHGEERPTRRVAVMAADGQAPAAVFVWKTVADPFAGRITMFRVISRRGQGGLDGAEPHARRLRAASAT